MVSEYTCSIQYLGRNQTCWSYVVPQNIVFDEVPACIIHIVMPIDVFILLFISKLLAYSFFENPKFMLFLVTNTHDKGFKCCLSANTHLLWWNRELQPTVLELWALVSRGHNFSSNLVYFSRNYNMNIYIYWNIHVVNEFIQCQVAIICVPDKNYRWVRTI